jgi:hypothetical protein
VRRLGGYVSTGTGREELIIELKKWVVKETKKQKIDFGRLK